MRLPHINRMGVAILPLGLALLFPATTLAQSKDDRALKEELRFISALIDSSYAHFAPDVIEAAKKEFPTAKGQFDAVTLRAKLRTGAFEEVEKIIGARPDKDSFDTWTLKMELAASYYAAKDYKKADDLYKAFFAKFKKVQPAQRSVYEGAIYYYVDMLKRLEREAETFPLYGLAMANASSNDSMKTFRASYLNGLLAAAEEAYNKNDKATGDKHCKEAEKLASEMLWVQDIYFGDAINAKAHLCMMRNDIKGAQSLMTDYLEMLTTIHNQLKEDDPSLLRISPLPKCRYLLGSMMFRLAEEEIKKAGGKVDKNSAPGKKVLDLLLGERNPKTKKRNQQGALYHCANVFMNYPEAESAENAIAICDKITVILEEHYKTKINITADDETRAKVRFQKFVNADVLFSQAEFQKAYDAYEEIFSDPKEKDSYTLDMMGPRMKQIKASLYIDAEKLKNKEITQADLYKDAKKLIKAFAENYATKKNCVANAGQALGELADFCEQNKMPELRGEVEGYFFKHYGNDPGALARKLRRARDVIATSKNKAEVQSEVNELEKIIAENKADDQRDTRKDALFIILDAYKRKDSPLYDNTKRTATAKRLVEHFEGIERPGYYAAAAVFEQGNALVDLGVQLRRENTVGENEKIDKKIKTIYTIAIRTFQDLVDELEKGSESSKYITTAEELEQVATIQDVAQYLIPFCAQRKGDTKTAIKGYSDYLKKYPEGRYAPMSLLQMGTMYAAEGTDEGVKKSQTYLDELQKKFGTSAEAQNAIPLLADALSQMGYRDQAVAKYREMFKSSGSYTAAQYLTAARKLFEVKDYDLTIEAAEVILALKNLSRSNKNEATELRIRALMTAGSSTKNADKIAKARTAIEEAIAQANTLALQRLNLDLATHEMMVATTLEERAEIIKRAQASEKRISNSTIQVGDDRRPIFDSMGRNVLKPVELDETGKILNNPPLVKAETSLAIAKLAKAASDNDQENFLGPAINACKSAMNAVDLDTLKKEITANDPAMVKQAKISNIGTISAIIQEAYVDYLELMVERRNVADMANNAEDRQFYAEEIKRAAAEYITKFDVASAKDDIAKAIQTGLYKSEVEKINNENSPYVK